MNRTNIIQRITALIICTLILISCKHNSSDMLNKEHKISKEQREELINSNKKFEKETPFKLREFDPHLNGEWIGNAVSYGCYRKGQAPGNIGPSEPELLEDLTIISKYWNLIRVYNADDDTERILDVIEKNNLPIKVVVGIWLENEEDNPKYKKLNFTNVLRGIELADNYENIIASLSVGNETLVYWSGHKMNPKNLIQYIRFVRSNTNVPVTVADDYNFWNKEESKQVVDEIDFIIAHIYPLWNGKTLDNAIEWMDSTYFNDVKTMHPDKLVVIGETGWATDYNSAKVGPGQQGSLIKGEVSLEAQEKFLVKLNKWIEEKRITTFLFEAFDEPWKGGGDSSPKNEVEKHWGVFYENRMPKESFENYTNSIVDKEIKKEK